MQMTAILCIPNQKAIPHNPLIFTAMQRRMLCVYVMELYAMACVHAVHVVHMYMYHVCE